MPDVILSTQKLQAHYGDFQALFDLDLNIEDGEVIAIIGANGAGKSTLMPEGRQLFPSLTVEENLIIGGQTGRTGPWNLQTIYELFPILQERRNVEATELSGGQQQMVAIGRALMSNPDLIMFDEISLGLAPVIIKTIYDALPGIINKGMSAMIVEQDISKALAVSSRFYCLQEGKIALEGASQTAKREDISRAYFGVH